LETLCKAFSVDGKLGFNVLNNDTADLFDINFRKELLPPVTPVSLRGLGEGSKILCEVVLAFNKNIKELFAIDIFESPTLPSLAFKIFTKNYLKHEIELTWFEKYNNYKEAYLPCGEGGR